MTTHELLGMILGPRVENGYTSFYLDFFLPVNIFMFIPVTLFSGNNFATLLIQIGEVLVPEDYHGECHSRLLNQRSLSESFSEEETYSKTFERDIVRQCCWSSFFHWILFSWNLNQYYDVKFSNVTFFWLFICKRIIFPLALTSSFSIDFD